MYDAEETEENEEEDEEEVEEGGERGEWSRRRCARGYGCLFFASSPLFPRGRRLLGCASLGGGGGGRACLPGGLGRCLRHWGAALLFHCVDLVAAHSTLETFFFFASTNEEDDDEEKERTSGASLEAQWEVCGRTWEKEKTTCGGVAPLEDTHQDDDNEEEEETAEEVREEPAGLVAEEARWREGDDDDVRCGTRRRPRLRGTEEEADFFWGGCAASWGCVPLMGDGGGWGNSSFVGTTRGAFLSFGVGGDEASADGKEVLLLERSCESKNAEAEENRCLACIREEESEKRGMG